MAVEIKNVKKVFSINKDEIEVLRDINLEIKDNEIISIVGASGCGKSTLLKLLIGLDEASEGQITVDGKSPFETDSTEIGMIFQEARLFPWKTVEKNIEFGIENKSLTKGEKKELVSHYIELVGLQGFEKALPNQLSGGMKQRVSIARTLINKPKILLLDEPFGALDAFTKINLQNEMLNIWEKEKTTMIIVTHDIDEAIYLGSRVVVMSPKPGVIQNTFDIQIPRPRNRTSDDFDYYRKNIYKEFFGENKENIEYII
ncbi:MAG: ABC transporter ATP-binding protein [Lachnospiraceae bacterium]|nr:ABC transporter ATP-binding protein [Lachnospiraceae bacterium]